jgi:hypothetical protein
MQKIQKILSSQTQMMPAQFRRNAGPFCKICQINYQLDTMNSRVACLGGPKNLGVRHKIPAKPCIAVQRPTQGRFRNALIARASDKEEEDIYNYGNCWFRNL